MTPESADCLSKARESLDDAIAALSLALARIAAREAYVAAFQAAQAYIFERSGKGAKTHRGVRAEFGRLAQNDPRIGPELMVFLGTAYKHKENADYAVGAAFKRPTPDEAAKLVDEAFRFVEAVEAALS